MRISQRQDIEFNFDWKLYPHLEFDGSNDFQKVGTGSTLLQLQSPFLLTTPGKHLGTEETNYSNFG